MEVAIVGESNAGKTFLFNKLTGQNSNTNKVHAIAKRKATFANVTFTDIPGFSSPEFARSAMRLARLLVIVIEQKSFSEKTIQYWVNMGFLNTIHPGILVCLTKSENELTPKCEYKCIAINTKTGLGISDFCGFIKTMADRMFPDAKSRITSKPNRGWFWWLKRGCMVCI